MSTHPAVVTVTPSGPLEIRHVTTPPVGPKDVKLVVQYTASTPLDLHQAMGHLLVTPPQIMGDGVAGTVIEAGPAVTKFRPGDVVFGFVYREAREKAHQLYCVTEERMLGLLPKGRKMEEGVVLGNNFVTAWHTLTTEFGIALPWPKSNDWVPREQAEGEWFLIWGAGSSCGMYVLQILKWYGVQNIIAVASGKHHEKLKGYGAEICFDYRQEGVEERINRFIDEEVPGKRLKFMLDCIGSLEGSVTPLSKIARNGTTVGSLLPVIERNAAEGVLPAYSFDVGNAVKWAEVVTTIGIRTHQYMENEFLAQCLQTEIMPAALEQNIVEPNEIVFIEGKTLLERAEKALSILRDKNVSGARLVWKVAEPEQVDAVLHELQK